MKNRLLKIFIRKPWGKRRELPQVAKKNFKQLWAEKQREK